jgi:hypothetical protein
MNIERHSSTTNFRRRSRRIPGSAGVSPAGSAVCGRDARAPSRACAAWTSEAPSGNQRRSLGRDRGSERGFLSSLRTDSLRHAASPRDTSLDEGGNQAFLLRKVARRRRDGRSLGRDRGSRRHFSSSLRTDSLRHAASPRATSLTEGGNKNKAFLLRKVARRRRVGRSLGCGRGSERCFLSSLRTNSLRHAAPPRDTSLDEGGKTPPA